MCNIYKIYLALLFTVIVTFPMASHASDKCTFQNQGSGTAIYKIKSSKSEQSLDENEIRFAKGECEGLITRGQVLVCFTSKNNIDCMLNKVLAKDKTAPFGPKEITKDSDFIETIRSLLPGFLFAKKLESIASAKAAGDQKTNNGFPFGHVLHSNPFIIYANVPKLASFQSSEMANVVQDYPSINAIELTSLCKTKTKTKTKKHKPILKNGKFIFDKLPIDCEYEYLGNVSGGTLTGSFSLINPENNELYAGYTAAMNEITSLQKAPQFLKNYQILLLMKDFGLTYDAEVMSIVLAETIN